MSQPCLIESFELMYFYDEHLGHLMWYMPLYGVYLVYYYGCFSAKPISLIPLSSLPYHTLVIASAGYQWYLVTEGQLFEIFMLSLIVMVFITMYKKGCGYYIDSNGVYLLAVNSLTVIFVIVWCCYLWNDEALRIKYPGIIYVPEPWSYWSLYHMNR